MLPFGGLLICLFFAPLSMSGRRLAPRKNFQDQQTVKSLRIYFDQTEQASGLFSHTNSSYGEFSSSAVPCYKIPIFDSEELHPIHTPIRIVGTILRSTHVPLVTHVGDQMTLSCLREWEFNDGRCVWIPGYQGKKTEKGTFRPACQPNCLHPESQRSEQHCVDPTQKGQQQLCEWSSGRCIYNRAKEDRLMTWHDIASSQTYDFGPDSTPRNVREYYCDARNWGTRPSLWEPATPLRNAGQVRFCYGVGMASPEPFDRSLPTLRNVCPAKERLPYLLTDYFVKAFGGGGSGAKVWGVMCTQREASTCRYVLKALTVKEASVVHRTMQQAGDPVNTLLMPTCAWWIPGAAPVLNLRSSNFSLSFSSFSNEQVKEGNDGGRVWVLMPNMAHASFLPGELVGSPIDVKGWHATTGKVLIGLTRFLSLNLIGKTNETHFKDGYSNFDVTFDTPAGSGQWPTKLSRSLMLLAGTSVSDYSLFFAFSRIADRELCRNSFNWPQLILAHWKPAKNAAQESWEWLCVAASIIDFTKEESDFGFMDGKQTNALEYAQNMLGLLVDSNPSSRLVKLSQSAFDELHLTQQTLAKG